MESYSQECLVFVINQQAGGAPSHHDPNETADQISEDNLTQDALQDEDEATRTARREQETNARESAGPEQLSALAFPRAISTRTSTMFVVVLQTTAGWRKAPALAQRVCTRG